MPPPATSSPSPNANASTSSDNNDNPPSSKDSEGYPSWLPKRPPPPPPTSTFQSSMIGFHDTTPSPVDAAPFVGGRKPTPRSVRIVSLEDSFVGAVEKETRFTREPTDQSRVDLPPKVLARASAVLPAAFKASEHDEFLPLPQPRFNAKNLHLQLLRNPSRWMKLYFYLWPLIVLYHIPLQSFFDFNAVFILFQVSIFPNSQSSSKNWALAAAAYIACWLVWIFIICLVYELVYSFARRWRLRRPLMLPIYLSSSAFNYAAMTSYTNFSFLQHLRFSAFFPEPAPTPQSPSDPENDAYYDGLQSPWKSGIAETCFFYSQNLPTVAMLIPRAGLSMALLFAFSNPPASAIPSVSLRDQTFFRSDGSLTDYARGVLFANAAWTGWRLLVLIASWLGLWIMSKQRLAGLCGPRHTWEESDQEKSRSIYSEAVSECGPYRSNFYHDGDALDYAGDELAWEWREVTRMRVQDAFEFCLTSARGGSGTTGATGATGAIGLRWSSVSSNAVRGAFGYKNRRYMDRHRRRRSAKDKEPSNEKSEFGADVASDEGFEGIEKVLAAVGFPSTSSPSRRGVLSEDLFAAPASFVGREPQKQEYPTIEPLRYRHEEPGPSTGMFTGLEPPKMAKRSSKDKIPGSSTTVGEAPLLHLPYPFSKPGSGQVSSNDLVLFPVGAKPDSQKSQGSDRTKTSKSGASRSKSTSGGSGSTSGSREEEIEEDDDDDEDDDEEGDDFDSEEPSEPASGSMSSLGHPISPSRYPFGTRRPGGAGHRRTPSGVSSGMSSGAAVSGGSHAHSHSMSSSHGTKSVMGVSVLSQSTGNRDSTDSESGVVEGRSLLHGSSPLSGGVIPMPPRHPHPQGQGRGRSGTSPSSTVAAAAAALAGVRALHTAPIAFPAVHQQRRRADSGRGIMIDPVLLYGSDIEGQHEFNDDDLNELPDDDDDPMADDDNEDEQAELEDRVGLLDVPSNPLASHSRISLSASQSSSSGSDARSRTHSSFSIHSSRSRHSSTRARSRSRTHSSHGPSVRERASSLGTSMRSLMRSTTASMTQLDLIMRGATGPAAGLGVGSRPRSRVNSSMARLEEDDHEMLSTTSAVPAAATTEEMNERRVSGGSTGNASHHGSGEVPVSSLMVGRLRQEFEEGYSSSGGTHSRSGSEMSGENYTFGRPVLFMRPVQEQQDQPQDLVEADEDEDEIVLMERSNRGSSDRSVPTLSMTTDPGEGGTVGEPKSFISESIYSQHTSEATASPGRGATPIPLVPIHRSLSDSPTSSGSNNSAERSPERQGLAIPWNHAQQQQREQQLLAPPLQPWEQAATTSSGSSSGSPAYISTAAESSVTSAPTMGSTMTSDSSGPRTSSWGGSAGGVRLGEVGGMVERNGEDMGDGAGERVV